ncbi:ankyrin repeat domain-containing protein [Candidatus Tisiphia endosymbiont of Ceraclea dissimilis]|uniref:ankyrin repeat domain-containing protein n=1 Tax=Candidatus Tisiphia endosymbiont of Ceraclea dissimilis TaxID=3077928 RepID=UPI003CCA82DC
MDQYLWHINLFCHTLYISERYNEYTNITQFNKTITNQNLLNDIELNLNNSLNLFYNNSYINASPINIIDVLKTQKNYQSLTPLELTKELQNHGLSLGQANYITVYSTQGGIGKSNILHYITSKIGFNASTFVHRPSSLSQIIIDNDQNVQYIGGQFILFDIPQQKYLEALNKEVGIENYLFHQSHNRVILYITISLGKLRQELTKKSLNIHIDVASEGEVGNQILAAFSSIKLTCKNIDPGDVVNNYIEFSDKTLYRNKLEERYELIHSIIEDEKVESDNIASEDLDTLLTISAINIPNKETVKLILKEGANANCFDQDHNTILHLIALESGSCEIAQVLLEHGADPNIINHDGNTPLHIAAKNNYREMIMLLTNNGADVTITNKCGHTYNSSKEDINATGELQNFNNFLLEREFCNISLHSISTINLKAPEKTTAIIDGTTKHSSSWNLFKNTKTATKQFVTGALNKHHNKSNLSCDRAYDNITLIEDILNLFEIVKKIVNYTITSNDIVKLQEIFAATSIKNTKEQFVTQLSCVLSDNQLHNLNTVIMQTMHQLLPEEDKICYLRSSENKIFHNLLLLEAKRHNMVVPLPNNVTTTLSMPTVPDVVFDLYATLKDWFYNQKERQSSEDLKDRIVKSIQWLFINPLITDCPIDLQLLNIPGEYTKLLLQNNIPDRITHIDIDAIQTLTNKEFQLIINQIFQIYMSDLTNLMVKEIFNKTALNINQSSENILANVILAHLQMHSNPYILLSNSTLILDEISNFVKAVYTPTKNQKQDLLSIFLYNFISKMHLENQITTEEDYQVKQHITNTDTALDEISHINNIIKSNDYIPLVKITNHKDFIQHLQKYYSIFLGKPLIDKLLTSYSHLGEQGNKHVLEEVQYNLVVLGNLSVIDWSIKHEGMDPILLLDNAIHHYALPHSDQDIKQRMFSIIKYILTDDDITDHFTLSEIKILLEDYSETKNTSDPVYSDNIIRIFAFIDLIIHDSWNKETINLLHCNNDHINNVEDALTSLGEHGLDSEI